MIKFTISQKLPGLNEYTRVCRKNKYAGNSYKQETEEMILWELKAVKAVVDRPVYIHFIWHELSKKRDKDNVCFAKKFILDALQKSGILPNDNNSYVLGFTDTFIYDKQSKVEVIIDERVSICQTRDIANNV